MNPTRMRSAIVDRQEPRKSYFINELGRKFTPISEEKQTVQSVTLSIQ